jgi:hypothetical protein
MKFRYFFQLTSPNVDRANSLIKNASVIALGEAKGHGVFCDDKTLTTVKDCVTAKYGSGLKVKCNPESFEHGPGGIAGKIPASSLRILDGQLLGTLEILKSYPARDYIFDLVETQPDTFGLSIDFDGQIETIDGVDYMRCLDIFAVTIVDEPAANASGFFSALPDSAPVTPKPEPSMSGANTPPPAKTTPAPAAEMPSADDIKSLMQSVANIATALETIQKEVAALKGGMADEADPDVTGMSEDDIAEEMAAAGVGDGDSKGMSNRKVHAYRRNLDKPLTGREMMKFLNRAAAQTSSAAFAATGGRAMRTGGGGDGGDTKKPGGKGGGGDPKRTEFQVKVDALSESGDIKPAQAFSIIRKKHPQLFEAHRKAQISAHHAKVAAAGGDKKTGDSLEE